MNEFAKRIWGLVISGSIVGISNRAEATSPDPIQSDFDAVKLRSTDNPEAKPFVLRRALGARGFLQIAGRGHSSHASHSSHRSHYSSSTSPAPTYPSSTPAVSSPTPTFPTSVQPEPQPAPPKEYRAPDTSRIVATPATRAPIPTGNIKVTVPHFQPEDLGPGDENDAVQVLQTLLTIHGYGCAVSGVLDTATAKQLATFQSESDVTVSGHADNATWEALKGRKILGEKAKTIDAATFEYLGHRFAVAGLAKSPQSAGLFIGDMRLQSVLKRPGVILQVLGMDANGVILVKLLDNGTDVAASTK